MVSLRTPWKGGLREKLVGAQISPSDEGGHLEYQNQTNYNKLGSKRYLSSKAFQDRFGIDFELILDSKWVPKSV